MLALGSFRLAVTRPERSLEVRPQCSVSDSAILHSLRVPSASDYSAFTVPALLLAEFGRIGGCVLRRPNSRASITCPRHAIRA
jgi:hypothetical protein